MWPSTTAVRSGSRSAMVIVTPPPMPAIGGSATPSAKAAATAASTALPPARSIRAPASATWGSGAVTRPPVERTSVRWKLVTSAGHSGIGANVVYSNDRGGQRPNQDRGARDAGRGRGGHQGGAGEGRGARSQDRHRRRRRQLLLRGWCAHGRLPGQGGRGRQGEGGVRHRHAQGDRRLHREPAPAERGVVAGHGQPERHLAGAGRLPAQVQGPERGRGRRVGREARAGLRGGAGGGRPLQRRRDGVGGRLTVAAVEVDVEAVVPSGALLIGDEWIDQPSGGRMDHINPATGEPLTSFALAGRAEIDAAVAAARAAAPSWRAMPAQQRRVVISRIATLLEERVLEHNTLRSLEAGSPFKPPAPGGRWLAGEYFHSYAGWVDKLAGETPVAYSAPSLDYTVPEPYGVVGIIVPWNAPVSSAAMKVAPALAAGNCVVLKPSELSALTPQLFAQLCLDAGLPPGVLNVVPGGREPGP